MRIKCCGNATSRIWQECQSIAKIMQSPQIRAEGKRRALGRCNCCIRNDSHRAAAVILRNGDSVSCGQLFRHSDLRFPLPGLVKTGSDWHLRASIVENARRRYPLIPMLSLRDLHTDQSFETLIMNRKQLACRVLFTFAAIGMPENVAIGEAPCACQNRPSAPTLPAFNTFYIATPQTDSSIMTRLPGSWPRQWAEPIINNPTASREENGASGLATSDQSTIGSATNTKSPHAPANWPSQRIASRANSALTSTVPSVNATDPAIGSDSKSSSAFGADSQSSASGTSGFSSSPAFGGGGFAGGGGSASGGSFGGGSSGGGFGGFSGSTTSAPRSSPSAGFGGGGSSAGESSSGFLSTSKIGNDDNSTDSTETQDSTETPSPPLDPNSTPNLIPDPTPDPTPDPGDGGGGFAEIPPPMCEMPPVLPEIPPAGGDPTTIPDFTPGNGVGDTPVVPEPGSIVLLAIGAGVSGGAWLRRRKKLKAATVSSHLNHHSSLTNSIQ